MKVVSSYILGLIIHKLNTILCYFNANNFFEQNAALKRENICFYVYKSLNTDLYVRVEEAISERPICCDVEVTLRKHLNIKKVLSTLFLM